MTTVIAFGVPDPASGREALNRLTGLVDDTALAFMLLGGDGVISVTANVAPRAVSDVYQDVFAEGSFIGKGIYDIDAFEHVLGGRLPENLVLSHDKTSVSQLESCTRL